MTCESCGAEEASLFPVHRIYVLAADDGPGDDQVQPDIEEWCVACMTQYPHQPIGP